MEHAPLKASCKRRLSPCTATRYRAKAATTTMAKMEAKDAGRSFQAETTAAASLLLVAHGARRNDFLIKRTIFLAERCSPTIRISANRHQCEFTQIRLVPSSKTR